MLVKLKVELKLNNQRSPMGIFMGPMSCLEGLRRFLEVWRNLIHQLLWCNKVCFQTDLRLYSFPILLIAS